MDLRRLKTEKFVMKPVNNHIVISGKEQAEWFVKEVCKPLTQDRIARNREELKDFAELFFNDHR